MMVKLGIFLSLVFTAGNFLLSYLKLRSEPGPAAKRLESLEIRARRFAVRYLGFVLGAASGVMALVSEFRSQDTVTHQRIVYAALSAASISIGLLGMMTINLLSKHAEYIGRLLSVVEALTDEVKSLRRQGGQKP